MTLRLSAKNLSVNARKEPLLSSVSLDLAPNKLTCLIGPNGAGKTTLLRALTGFRPADEGDVFLNEKPLSSLSIPERARLISYLPQSRSLAWPLRVRDAVALGRFAYGGQTSAMNPRDKDAIDQALIACELTQLSDRRTDTLSGGELSRVHLARALCSQAPILIADEPLAALDPRQQLQTLGLVRNFVETGGTACLVLHDLALAARHADQLIWMKSGQILHHDATETTLTPDIIRAVFDVESEVSDRSVIILGPCL